MKKYLLLLFAFISSVIFFLQTPAIFNQDILADNPPGTPHGNGPTQVDVQCSCINANTPDVENKNGQVTTVNNGYNCPDSRYGLKGACGHAEQECITINGTNAPKGADLIPQSIQGSAVVHYTGVACQTKVTCSCSGNHVVCTNPVLQAAGVPKQTYQQDFGDCGSDKVCLQGNVQVHVAWNQPVYGADCQRKCTCGGTNGSAGSHGKTGNGNNYWTCAGSGTKLYCGNREDYCQNNPNSPGGVECVNSAKCTCSSDKTYIQCTSSGSVNPTKSNPNGNDSQKFQCNGPTCITGSNVDQPDFRYKNQHITGIKCNNPEGPTNIPPPPSPPCLHWDSKGVCQTFGSTFGPFYTDPDGFIQKVFAVLLSVSGGIALLLIMKAGYQMMTAQGNPEKLNNAREQLVAAIVGLIFLIFSFVFLQLIGFDILKIPGFQGGTQTANNTQVCNPGSCIPTTFCTAKNPGHCNSNGCPSGQSCVQ